MSLSFLAIHSANESKLPWCGRASSHPSQPRNRKGAAGKSVAAHVTSTLVYWWGWTASLAECSGERPPTSATGGKGDGDFFVFFCRVAVVVLPYKTHAKNIRRDTVFKVVEKIGLCASWLIINNWKRLKIFFSLYLLFLDGCSR